MFSKNAQIDLSGIEITSGGRIVSRDPLVIEHTEGEIRFTLAKSEGDFEWHKNDCLIFDMTAQMNSRFVVDVDFLGEGAELLLNYALVPRRRVRMTLRLRDLDSSHVFLETLPGHFKGHISGQPTDISKIDTVNVGIHDGRGLEKVTIHGVYVTDAMPDLTVEGASMVDKLGQWKDMDWDSKTHSEEELVNFLRGEYEKYKNGVKPLRDDVDRFGGWKKLKFEAKGYFYKQWCINRWWLVDPDGYAFFSNGVCYATRMGVHGFVDKMENLFDWLPAKDDKTFADAWTKASCIPEFVKRNGREAGEKRDMFNFARANMIRAFGPDKWWDAWVTINSARLKEWGFNTISVCVNNYYDERVEDYLKKAEMPFTWTFKEFPKTKNLIFRDFPDVFDPEYEALCDVFAQQVAPFRGNEYFIGYYMNNEPEWMFQKTTSLSERCFAYPGKIASKIALVGYLEKKYGGDINLLNAAWGKSCASFEDLYTPFEYGNTFSDAAAKDFEEMRDLLIEKYTDVPARCIEKVVPNLLNLGMRYGAVKNPEDFAGEKLSDIFSFNAYRKNIQFNLDAVNKYGTMPFIIGEWHFGGSDKGLLANGLVNATTQHERGLACMNYMYKCWLNKKCIGITYFEFNDQPLLGRFDGENMQHGLIDICNRPHYDCIEVLKEANLHLYEILSGDYVPTIPDFAYAERY